MTPLKQNLLANFAGKGWAALMSLAFVPMYIRFMGIEAYGLVGVSLSLFALFSLLDLGLSTTLNRELARLAVQENKVQEMRDLVRTLELIYWGIALLIGVVVGLLAPLIAHHWVKADMLSPETISQALTIMGLSLLVQWPFSLYSGGLLGLQRHVLLNGITAGTATVRGVGAVLVLWLIAPTVQVFFLWQLLASVFQTVIVAVCLWSSLQKTESPARFNGSLLKSIGRFAAGVSGISVMAVVLTQLDKVILSKLLTLEMFGYYTVATLIASAVTLFVGPIFSTVFPRFSNLVATGETNTLKNLYHQSSQLVSVAVLPLAIVVIVFSQELLLFWTRDHSITQHTSVIVSLLTIGALLNALMNMPYALQLAYGWTKLAFYLNLACVIVLVPLIFWATTHYGAIGAACAWIALNVLYVIAGLHFMHARLLKEEKWRWIIEDVGRPLVTVAGIVGIGRWLLPEGISLGLTLAWTGAVFVLSLLGAALMAEDIRSFVRRSSLMVKACNC